MTNEAKLWTRVRHGLILAAGRAGIGIDYARIENGVQTGMPDANVCVAGVEWWIELKCVKQEPARPRTPLLGSSHKITPAQRLWAAHRRAAGGRVAVLIGTPARCVLLPMDGADYNAYSVDELLGAALWATGARLYPLDFDKLLEVLKNGRTAI